MGGFSTSLVAIALFAAAAGCDSRAKASDPPGARAEAKSKEYESCGASMHCADELRCFDNVCRRAARSTVGDYYAALGAASKARGELEAAIDSYNKALGHYDSEKIALPPDVDCAYGATLAAARAKKEHAELGARVLHRCILAVPTGSPLRDRALAELATLTEAGLDPLALGRTALADVYLTRAPQKPASDKLQVSVTPTPAVDKKTFPMVTERLAQPDIKAALVACWEAYNAATKKDSMTVALPIRWAYIQPEYDDEAGRFAFKMEPAAGVGAGPDAVADQCARAAVEPALKGLTTVRDAFATKLTITVK
jgi:tetratricopeptide (TPR) repeat protein